MRRDHDMYRAGENFPAFRQEHYLEAALERLCTCHCVKVACEIPNCLKRYGRKIGLCGLASDFGWGLGSLMLYDCLNCCQQITSNHLYHGARGPSSAVKLFMLTGR